MLKFQECVGSTSSRFKVGYFYFLWIKIVQNFSSISLFERSRCACEFRSSLHLSFLRLVCEFLFFSSPFPFFVNKLFHFESKKRKNAKTKRETQEEGGSAIFFLKLWSKPWEPSKISNSGGSTLVRTVLCFLCIKQLLGLKEPYWSKVDS